MAPSLSLSGFLRASRRNLFPTLVILVLSFLIARHRADHIQMKLEAAFWAPSVPKNGPLPPQRTAEATDAECRAAALAADALVATFEGFGNSMDTDVAAQFNSLRKAMLGPGNCGQGNALEVNRSEPHLEWRKIFKNLQMDLVSSGEPGRPRRLPSLLFPRAATDETRLDLALAVSLVAQQLMATPRASISANTFDQFSARQVS